MIFEGRSAHLGALGFFSIAKPDYLGCKGSWVQIPPRRPFNSNTYIQNEQNSHYPFLPRFTWGASLALGANSAQIKTIRTRIEDSLAEPSLAHHRAFSNKTKVKKASGDAQGERHGTSLEISIPDQ